jgi:hypothetical protein
MGDSEVDDELQQAKAALKQAMLSGDQKALAKAEAELVRIKKLKPPDFRVVRA